MPQTILVLAANPKNTSSLRLDEEIREIGNGLQRSQKREKFVLETRLAVRPVDVRRAMLDCKPTIVHFCGHGAGEEGIAFEDDHGIAKLVSAEVLMRFFELFTDHLKCVVLNACYSELQAEAIARHIPYVVGMRRAIGDEAAVQFSTAFYDALGAGQSFQFAFKFACNAMEWLDVTEHLTPILMSNRSIDDVLDSSDELAIQLELTAGHVVGEYCGIPLSHKKEVVLVVERDGDTGPPGAVPGIWLVVTNVGNRDIQLLSPQIDLKNSKWHSIRFPSFGTPLDIRELKAGFKTTYAIPGIPMFIDEFIAGRVQRIFVETSSKQRMNIASQQIEEVRKYIIKHFSGLDLKELYLHFERWREQ